MASSSDDGSVSIWDIRTGKQINSFPEDHSFTPFWSLHFLPDGNTIVHVGGFSMSYQASDVITRKILLKGEINAINTKAMVFWPDAKTYARAGENRSGLPYILPPLGSTVDTHIYIEQLADVQPLLLRTLTGHKNLVTSLALSQDSNLLVSGSDDHTVRLWDVSK